MEESLFHLDPVLGKFIEIILEAIFVSGILGHFFTKREEYMKKIIAEEFKKRDALFNTQLDYKRRVLEELLGPMMMQLKRSKITLSAYVKHNIYREGILKQCNETVRDLLLSKGHLIPSNLQVEAGEFLKHYDEWLQKHHQIREIEKDMDKPFVFTYNFPKKAEKNLLNQYEILRHDLKIDESLK